MLSNATIKRNDVNLNLCTWKYAHILITYKKKQAVKQCTLFLICEPYVDIYLCK